MWRNMKFFHICHVEKSEFFPQLSCGDISDFFIWQMWRILKWPYMKRNFSRTQMFFCNLCCCLSRIYFVAIYAFCVEKILDQNCICGEKWQIWQELPNMESLPGIYMFDKIILWKTCVKLWMSLKLVDTKTKLDSKAEMNAGVVLSTCQPFYLWMVGYWSWVDEFRNINISHSVNQY